MRKLWKGARHAPADIRKAGGSQIQVADLNPLLRVKDLIKMFPVQRRAFGPGRGGQMVRAVDGIDFDILPGETLALVGESGCGKTTAARCASLLYKADAGEIYFQGRELSHEMKGSTLKQARRNIQMVFQDPFGSLNPRLPISAIIGEPLQVHSVGNRRERRERVQALLEAVELPANAADRYPHEFSGGQRQRIAIARALALDPALIVADEPLSALDVSVQASILDLLLDLREKRKLSYLFISHDLAVVDWIADRVAVMYCGRIVETGSRKAIFNDPRHPYTRALLEAVPKPGRGKRIHHRVPWGEPPNPADPPSGCAFHPRCRHAKSLCQDLMPVLGTVAGNETRRAACHFRDEN